VVGGREEGRKKDRKGRKGKGMGVVCVVM